MVEITCPNCNYSKKIAEDKIPAGAKWARCPQCNNRFDIKAIDTGSEPEPDIQKGQKPKDSKRVPSPWEKRSEIGIWQGILNSAKQVLMTPGIFFKTLTYKGGIREPLAYGLLLGSIGSMFSFFWQFLMIPESIHTLSDGLLGRAGLNIFFIGIIILIPFFVLFGMFITSLIAHVCLLMVRSGTNRFEGTFRVIAFSQVPQILGIIPFLGGFIAFIWGIIILIFGLKEIHDTDFLKVIFALLIPFIFIFFLVIVIAISLSVIF